MKIEEILSIIQGEDSISPIDSFTFAQICAKYLRGSEKEQGFARKILIYILDNRNKILEEDREIRIDIIECAGFYPYLERNGLIPTDLQSQLRKEVHGSSNLPNKYFHEEQKYLYEKINEGKNLIVSAPTSFGKSLLIEEIIASNKYSNIVVIQPTLALLDETRKKLHQYQENYKIIVRTSQEPSEDKGNLFLLTAERVMEYQNLPEIDFFIIDEFYKLSSSRDDERLDTLNNAFYKLLKFDGAQFYLLGPNIDGISPGFAEKYNAEFYRTDYSLIANQIIDEYTGKKDIYNQSRSVEAMEEKENDLFDRLWSLRNEQTIIYCSSPARVKKLAYGLFEYLKNKGHADKNNVPLIERIEKNVDKQWNLIKFLSVGIGINDGSMPKHINSSMVDYFNEGKLFFMFCTTTIIEGVNTSAKNIIYFDNKKGRGTKIDYFDYSNIVGRSGRMMYHYVGKVYNFNKPPKKTEAMIVDIPFYHQDPIRDEVLNTLDDEDIKISVKETEQYQRLMQIPENERDLFRRNGVSVEGQKFVLDKLRNDIVDPVIREFIFWDTYPNYRQLAYVLSLAYNNFLKKKESRIPLNYLIKLTNSYGHNRDISKLIQDTFDNYKELRDRIGENKELIETQLLAMSTQEKQRYKSNDQDGKKYGYSKKYFELDDNQLYQMAISDIFQIMRHRFQYKVPKRLSVVNELQKYVAEEIGIAPSSYIHYASLIENDFLGDHLTILSEFGIPNSAIKKMERLITSDLSETQVIQKAKDLAQTYDALIEYEKVKILNNL